MYTSKKFKVKDPEKAVKEINDAASVFPDTRKVFLADGNVMVLSTTKLLRLLQNIQQSFPKLNRVSAYAIAKDVNNKSVEELIQLKEAGLDLLYVGIESGDDEVLQRINKGETAESTISNLLKIKAAGIKLSVMIINGLGGKHYTRQHAINSAHVVNKIQPEFLSTLVLSFPFGVDHFKQRFNGEFESLNTKELLTELHLIVDHTKLDKVIFRSDHASNYLSLKGILSKDKERILQEIKNAIDNPQFAGLREEWQRGL
jgi:radical SAM superfamily enzyme YgiQ (UPF0313 family)